MNEVSTAGILIKYACEATAGTRPTSGYTTIPNVTASPSVNGEPDSLEVTDLSDREWKRYILGLKDPGGVIPLTVNFTSAFKTVWETLVEAAKTAFEANKATWFEISIPTIGSFYIAGMPSELGIDSYEPNAVLQNTCYIAPNQVHGWDDASA